MGFLYVTREIDIDALVGVVTVPVALLGTNSSLAPVPPISAAHTKVITSPEVQLAKNVFEITVNWLAFV
jgi:hypothetical protein